MTTTAILSTTTTSTTTTISKSNYQFKQSPDTSRVTTPIHNLSSVIKYETTDTETLDKEQYMLADSEKNEEGNDDNVEGEIVAGEDYDDDNEQPCDLRLQRSLKIMSMALQQAAAVAAAGGGTTGGSNLAEHATSTTDAAAAAATAMAVMIGSSGAGVGGAVGATAAIAVTPNLTSTHAHSSLLNFTTPTSVASRSVSLLPSVLATNLDITPTDNNNLSITLTTTTTITTNATTTTTSSSAAGSTVTSLPPISVMPNTGSSVVGSGGSWGGAYTCERCGNSYARPHSLNRHVRFECGVEPKFECPICHKKSKHKHNLVLHMRTHQHR